MRRSAAVQSGFPLIALIMLLLVAALTPLGVAPVRADSPAVAPVAIAATGDYVASPILRARALKALFANFPKIDRKSVV